MKGITSMESVNSYQFDRISSHMAKEFGVMEKNNEEAYHDMLFPMESNMVKINRIHKINNSRRVVEAVHVCLFIIGGYINKKDYDLSNFTTKENKPYVDALLMSFDPFTNKSILKNINDKYGFSSVENLRRYFDIPVKCILRIEKSVELWTKERGFSGYFDFLEETFGEAVSDDNEMSFCYITDKKFDIENS